MSQYSILKPDLDPTLDLPIETQNKYIETFVTNSSIEKKMYAKKNTFQNKKFNNRKNGYNKSKYYGRLPKPSAKHPSKLFPPIIPKNIRPKDWWGWWNKNKYFYGNRKYYENVGYPVWWLNYYYPVSTQYQYSVTYPTNYVTNQTVLYNGAEIMPVPEEEVISESENEINSITPQPLETFSNQESSTTTDIVPRVLLCSISCLLLLFFIIVIYLLKKYKKI